MEVYVTLPQQSQKIRMVAGKSILMVGGLFLLAYGSVMGIEAALGVAPWHVLHIGLTNHIPVTVGRSTQISGFAILAVAMALGVRPRMGTWINMFLVGQMMDAIISFGLVPGVSSMAMRVLYMLVGVYIAALGVTAYMCADMGTGPRDSLMLGVTRKTGWRVGIIRSSLESMAVLVGFMLGGPVGIGTVVAAFLTGPSVEISLIMFSKLAKREYLSSIIVLPASVRFGRRTQVEAHASASSN